MAFRDVMEKARFSSFVEHQKAPSVLGLLYYKPARADFQVLLNISNATITFKYFKVSVKPLNLFLHWGFSFSANTLIICSISSNPLWWRGKTFNPKRVSIKPPNLKLLVKSLIGHLNNPYVVEYRALPHVEILNLASQRV